MSYIESLATLLNNEECSWQRTSATLDAAAKIYGFRVDCVHMETFRFISELNKSKNKSNSYIKNNSFSNENRKNLSSTIEFDIQRLNLRELDVEFNIDPLFKNMTSKFDNTGSKGLLLKILPINTNLDIFLESDSKSNIDYHTSNKINFKFNSKIIKSFNHYDILESKICPNFPGEEEKSTCLIMEYIENSDEDLMNLTFNISSDNNRDLFLCDNILDKKEFDQSKIEKINLVLDDSLDKSPFSANFNTTKLDYFSVLKDNDIHNYIEKNLGNGINKEIFGNLSKELLYEFHSDDIYKLKPKVNLKLSSDPNGKNLESTSRKMNNFNFMKENLVEKNEIFDDKKKFPSKNHFKFKIKKKKFYLNNYDIALLFNEFLIEKQEKISNINEVNFKQNLLINERKCQFERIDNDFMLNETQYIMNNDTFNKSTLLSKDRENLITLSRKNKKFDLNLIKKEMNNAIKRLSLKTNEISFSRLFEEINESLSSTLVNNVSIQLCFMSILHLANENNLSLVEHNEIDILINL